MGHDLPGHRPRAPRLLISAHRQAEETAPMLDRRRLIAATALAAAAPPPTAAAGPAAPVALTVSLRLQPGAQPEALRLLRPVLDAMRHEPSFINCVLHRDPEDPTQLMLYETWADLDDLRTVQMRRPYRTAYEARLPALLAAPREARLWQPLRADFTAFAR
jgi:quinol monooxygenase YgiN